MVEVDTALHCPACGTELSRDRRSAGLCPRCLIELALEDTSLEAELAFEAGEAPTLQFIPHQTFSEGEIQGDRYRIRTLLGRGGMGEVWRAYDLKLRLDVALKALKADLITDPRALETLRQEVRTAREVISPNVCRVFDLEELDGRELVSMEYVDGTTLLDILTARSPLELGEAQEIASQFLAGLGAIHAAGFVHRDLKPENLMITRTGRVVVMDFGIAKELAADRSGTVSGTPAYMAPEQARGEPLDARADIFSVAVVLAEMVSPDGARSTDARQKIWEAIQRDPPEVAVTPWAPVLKQAAARDKAHRHPSAAALARALEEVTLRAAGDETVQPYPGLAAFTEEQAEDFFGREMEVEEMWRKLRRPRLLGLIGPSGAGKSSFIRAGLLPAAPPGWDAVVATPGSRPFTALAQALLQRLSGDAEAMAAFLRFEEPDVAVSLFARWRWQHEQALIIVDQFEELFTQCPAEAQEAFADLLSRLALDADVHVLLSMRDDFLFHCQRFPALKPLFSELSPLGSLTGSALRRALVQPALRGGYHFEDDTLVDEMVAEVSEERGALPMLAFSAARLWERRDRERGLLTRQAYEQIGGVGGALAQHAEATLETIGPDRLAVVRDLFRNLVTAQSTRAAREREELLSVFGGSNRREAEQILGALVDARLLTTYEEPADTDDAPARQRIEIIHESLLSAWPRLVRWRTQDADSAQLRDQLRQAAQMWVERERPDDLLWAGTSFKEYELWRERYPGGLTAQEEAFAAAMAAKATRRRRWRRLAIAALVTAALGVAGVTSFFWQRSETARQQATAAEREARDEALRAEASKLLALAEARRDADPTEALAYTTASLELADTEEARIFALRLLWEGPTALEVEADVVVEEHGLWAPSFSPDGSRLAAGGLSEIVRVWAADGGPPVVLPGHEWYGEFPIIARWASNELVVTGIGGGFAREAHVWKVAGGESVRTIDFGAPARWQVGDTHLLAEVVETNAETGREDSYHLRSWKLPKGLTEDLGTIDTSTLGGSFSLFDADGSGWVYAKGNEIFFRPLPMREGVADRLVGFHTDEAAAWALPAEHNRLWTQDASTGELRLWDLEAESAEPLRVIAPPPALEPGAYLSPAPDGRWATDVPTTHAQFDGREATWTKQAQAWDTSAWAEAKPLALRRSGTWFLSMSTFHPRGDWLVVSTHGRTRLTLWPLRGAWSSVVDGYSGIFRPIEFSPDGRWLATIEDDRSLRLWPLPSSGTREVKRLPLPPQSRRPLWRNLVFDPQGRFVFVGAFSDFACVVPLDGSPPRTLEVSSDGTRVRGAAVSPSGRRVAIAGGGGAEGYGQKAPRVWNLETGELRLDELPGRPSPEPDWDWGFWDLAFADDSTLYTSGAAGIHRWNLDTGAYELVLPAKPGSDHSWAAFDPRARTVLVMEPTAGQEHVGSARILDLTTDEVSESSAFAETPLRSPTLWPVNAYDVSETVAATGDREGIVRVARLSGGEPHLLVGHEGPVDYVAISPDGRWIASTGEDDTLRLWPMPDLDKPALHALPLDELLAKLRSLTNIRVVRDSESAEGWKVTLDAFPGWKEVPTW